LGHTVYYEHKYIIHVSATNTEKNNHTSNLDPWTISH